MIKVQSVIVKPSFKLALRFSDGTRGVVDFHSFLEKRAFRSLRDEERFAEAFVERGAVTWPGDIAIASETLYAEAHGLPRPRTLEEARANEQEMSLRNLRELAGFTQVEAAEAMQVDQGQLSRLERQDDWKLSTLRRYVEALGGELEVVAVLGHKRLTLKAG